MSVGTDGPEASPLSPFRQFNASPEVIRMVAMMPEESSGTRKPTRRVAYSDLLRFGKFARQVMNERQLSGRSKMPPNDRYVSGSSHHFLLQLGCPISPMFA